MAETPASSAAMPAAPARETAPPRPPATIVPLWGLPIVAVILGLEIIALTADRLWALDFFHVVGGALWTSLDLFLGFVLGPTLARLSIQARLELTARLMPKMLLIMPTLVTMTLASGWQLARHLHYLDASAPYHGWVVASFVIVGVLAVIALGVLEPANLAVLFELRKPQPNGAVIARLMRRFLYTAGITGLGQVGILIIMTRLAT